MTKQRQRLLLDGLSGKCTLGCELARQLLDELNAYGPFSYLVKSRRYHAKNGQFAALALVQAWTVQRTIKTLTAIPQAAVLHGLYEAHVAMKDDATVRTASTPNEQHRAIEVALWRSEEEGQASEQRV